MAQADHSDEVLRVWPSRTIEKQWWSPLYGDLDTPAGWESQAPGDAFITREIKRLGPYWVALKARKGYTETLGLLAPAANIQEANRLAQETQARREATRARSREQRARQEGAYRQVFTEAVLHYLDFNPRYQALARKIAEKVAKQATEVGSGRVGRTEKLTLERKAELAARAYLRHRYTGYEDRMSAEDLAGLDEEARRDVRADAHGEVDEFLWEHRQGKMG